MSPILTNREAEVAVLLAHGLTTPEIAARLCVAPKTVESHIWRIVARLGLRNRAQIAAQVGVWLTLACAGAPW